MLGRSCRNSPPLQMHRSDSCSGSALLSVGRCSGARQRRGPGFVRKQSRGGVAGLYIMHDVLGRSVGSWSGLSLSAVVIQNRQSSQWSGRRAALNGLSSSSCKPANHRTSTPPSTQSIPKKKKKKHHIKRKTHKPRHSSASPVNPHLCGCKASLSSCLNIFKSLGSLSACCWGAVHSTKL